MFPYLLGTNSLALYLNKCSLLEAAFLSETVFVTWGTKRLLGLSLSIKTLIINYCGALFVIFINMPLSVLLLRFCHTSEIREGKELGHLALDPVC